MFAFPVSILNYLQIRFVNIHYMNELFKMTNLMVVAMTEEVDSWWPRQQQIFPLSGIAHSTHFVIVSLSLYTT